MNIELIEKEKNVIRMKIDDLTFVNLLNENIWKQKIEYSVYKKDHPYLSQPILEVKSKEPKKSLIDAAERIKKDAEEFKTKLERVLKD